MALIQCKTCNVVIVAGAKTCPQCGAALTSVFGNLVKFFVLLVFFVTVFGWLSSEYNQRTAGNPTPAMTAEQ
jgi:uncharacterized protein (UPF0212 family)